MFCCSRVITKHFMNNNLIEQERPKAMDAPWKRLRKREKESINASVLRNVHQ